MSPLFDLIDNFLDSFQTIGWSGISDPDFLHLRLVYIYHFHTSTLADNAVSHTYTVTRQIILCPYTLVALFGSHR